MSPKPTKNRINNNRTCKYPASGQQNRRRQKIQTLILVTIKSKRICPPPPSFSLALFPSAQLEDGVLKNFHIFHHPKQPFRALRKKIPHSLYHIALPSARSRARAHGDLDNIFSGEAPVRLTPAGVPVCDRAGLQQLYFPSSIPSDHTPSRPLLLTAVLVYLLDEIHLHTTLETQAHKVPGRPQASRTTET